MSDTDNSGPSSDFEKCLATIQKVRDVLQKSSVPGSQQLSPQELDQLQAYAHEIRSLATAACLKANPKQLANALEAMKIEARIWLEIQMFAGAFKKQMNKLHQTSGILKYCANDVIARLQAELRRQGPLA